MRLVESDELTDMEKLKILESWQMDLIELQKAEEENMPGGSEDPGDTARKLEAVTAAIETLRTSGGEDTPVEKPVREPPKKPHRPFRDVPSPQPIDDPKPSRPNGAVD
jgi:hypothetical protein